MIFTYQALGLIIISILICIYYKKTDSNTTDVNIYKSILLSTYILELLYVFSYVVLKDNSNIDIIPKIYLGLVVLIYMLYLNYYLITIYKAKYRINQEKYKIHADKSIKGSIIISLIILIPILMSDLITCKTYITGLPVWITYLIQIIIIITIGITFYKNHKYISIDNNNYLIIIYLSMIITLMIEFILEGCPVVNTSLVVSALLMYLTISSPNKKTIDRLKIERDYAVRNNQRQKKFLTNLSHELRQPLNTIDGFSQLIIDSDNLESIKEDAKDIRVASLNLIEIATGMIDLSIIENGNLEIINDNYNAYDMFDNICELLRLQLNDGVKLKVEIAKDIPYVLNGDVERVEQIILNVLLNACKYTKKGSITLNVSSISVNNNCRIKVIIKDTGTGIKKEELDQIFNFEDDYSNHEGYGLGLVIAKRLLTLMDGTIDVKSEYGKGTEFTLSIMQKIPINPTQVKNIKNKSTKPFDAGGSKVLIVDDNKLNIKVVTKMLAPYNVQVFDASSGEECLNILDKDNDFQLILMDDMMPKLSGSETLDILKKIERVDGYMIPVVVVTANCINGIRKKYLDNGFDDYLAKPIDKYELNRVLRKFLEKDQ